MIRVAGLDYRVVVTGNAGDFSNHDLIGEVDYDSCSINIFAGLTPKKQQQTFWHEVTHIIIEGEDISDPKDANERYVTRVSNILYSILADNEMLPEGWWDRIVDERPAYSPMHVGATRGRSSRTDHSK